MKRIIIPSYEEVKAKLKGPKGFRKTRTKKDGFVDYTWRMARFYSGIDPHMPVTCDGWIKEWCEFDYKKDSYDQLKVVMNIADDYAIKLCVDYNLGADGLYRWARIFGCN